LQMDLRGHRTRIDPCDDPELSYLSKLSTLRMVLQDTIAIIALAMAKRLVRARDTYLL
jgi:hypothetical protein